MGQGDQPAETSDYKVPKKVAIKDDRVHLKCYQTQSQKFFSTKEMPNLTIDLAKPHNEVLPKMIPHGKGSVVANTLGLR